MARAGTNSSAWAGREPVYALDRALRFGAGVWQAGLVYAALELGLFAALAAGPCSRAGLVERLRLHPRGAADFCDALVSVGLLDRRRDLYANSAIASIAFVPTSATYIGDLMRPSDERRWATWHELVDALRTGGPQPGTAASRSFSTEGIDEDLMAASVRRMTCFSMNTALALSEKYDWTGCQSVADIGTGEGIVAVEVGTRHPHMKVIGFDLPGLRKWFEPHIRRRGLDGRAAFHSGDFFRDQLPGAEVLVLSHILHDWSVDQRRELLSKAFAALPSDGTVIVCDAMIDNARRRKTASLLLSLNMLMQTPEGGEYTPAQCGEWLRAAGFRSVDSARLTARDTIVVARR
jgi:O-methyltransferase domain/Dimerisation domain